MIKYFKVKARRTTKDNKFTEGNIYIAKHSGSKEVIIYNNDNNGITMSIPGKCGFGVRHKYYTDIFDKIPESTSLAFDKEELREILKEIGNE